MISTNIVTNHAIKNIVETFSSSAVVKAEKTAYRTIEALIIVAQVHSQEPWAKSAKDLIVNCLMTQSGTRLECLTPDEIGRTFVELGREITRLGTFASIQVAEGPTGLGAVLRPAIAKPVIDILNYEHSVDFMIAQHGDLQLKNIPIVCKSQRCHTEDGETIIGAAFRKIRNLAVTKIIEITNENIVNTGSFDLASVGLGLRNHAPTAILGNVRTLQPLPSYKMELICSELVPDGEIILAYSNSSSNAGIIAMPYQLMILPQEDPFADTSYVKGLAAGEFLVRYGVDCDEEAKLFYKRFKLTSLKSQRPRYET